MNNFMTAEELFTSLTEATREHYQAMRYEAERLEALKLLRRVLEVREMGNQGPLKSDIREFLERSGK